MIEVLHESWRDIGKNISVNDIFIEQHVSPIGDDELLKIERYYESLKKAGFIDLVMNGHFYDKNIYDFYFVIGDASKNWYRKLILKSTVIDLVLKHKIINFVTLKYYGYN
jgi:hypothetical protein